MLKVDLAELRALERALGKINRDGIAYAARAGLTQLAKAGRLDYQKQMQQDTDVLRNRGQLSRIVFAPAKSLSFMSMQSATGSLMQHHAELEEGETRRGRGGKGVTVPAAEGRVGMSNRRPVKKRNYLSRLDAHRPTNRQGNRKMVNASRINQAKARGQRTVVLRLAGGGDGLFRIMGALKRKRESELRPLYFRTKRTIRTAPVPVLRHAMQRRTLKRAPRLLKRELLKQLKRSMGKMGLPLSARGSL